MRHATALAALLLVVLAWPAGAHTELAASSPADGEEVADPPAVLLLTFTTALLPGGEADVRVLDGAGDDLVSAPPVIDGLEVTVPLNLAVVPGDHVVDWRVVAADGDPVVGSFSYVFAPPAEIATPPGAVAPTSAPPSDPTPAAAPPSDPSAAASPPEPTPAASGPTEPAGATPPTAPGGPSAAEGDGSGSRAGVLVAALLVVGGLAAGGWALARRRAAAG